MIVRRIQKAVAADLKKKMVFLAGPRQCGKTTLSLEIDRERQSLQGKNYYNWDIDLDRKKILKKELSPDSSLWIFDELHKFRGWRNWLKGLYDEYQKKHEILVTGSARLELYSRGGDSLQGRYFLHRLHPLTFSELLGISVSEPNLIAELSHIPQAQDQKTLSDLFRLGGFPEPFFSSSDIEADKWRLSYGSRLVREEVRSLEQIQDLDRMELLFDQLPAHVSSVLSINSLREDLEVSFITVKKWIQAFERLYGVFRIFPFGSSQMKAVKKEGKLYFWDWARVEGEPARYENLLAVHLLRLCHWLEDQWGQKCELRFFRTTVGHEVDFILLRRGKPWIVVEAKWDDVPLDSNLKYFLKRVQVPHAFQVSFKGTKDFYVSNINGCKIRITPATRFLGNLP